MLQKCQRPSTTYMERMQPELTPNMRTVLIDWMVEVAGVSALSLLLLMLLSVSAFCFC